jgi:hypothetical protein
MQLSECKFIVTSGCSYDRFADSLLNPFLDCYLGKFETTQKLVEGIVEKDSRLKGLLNCFTYHEDNVIIVSLGVGGFSNYWISESIPYFVNFLFENNVPSESIYVLASFTHFSRFSVDYPSEHFNYVIPENVSLETLWGNAFGSNLETSKLANKLNTDNHYGRLNLYTGIGKLGTKYICNPTLVKSNESNFLGEDSDPAYIEAVKEMYYGPYTEYGKFVESVVEEQLNLIISTGKYLEDRGITYNFCSMHSLFNYLMEPADGVSPLHQVDLPTVYSIYSKDDQFVRKENSINVKGRYLEEAFPNLVNLVEQALSFNWTMYEYGNIERGGLDEFTLAEFGEAGYSATNRIFLDHSLPKPANHPHSFVYPFLFKYFAKDCKFISINEQYLSSVRIFIDKFFNKTTFNLEDSLNFPLITKGLYKDKINRWSELKKIYKRRWI